MAKQFIVLRKHGKWQIKSAEPDDICFPDFETAVKAAVDLAHESGRDGKPALVKVQREERFETIWTYGEDAYPVRISELIPRSGGGK